MSFKREELLILVRQDPERFVDLFLALQARIESLEARLAQNSSNSHKPPSSDGYSKPAPKSLRPSSGLPSGGQKGHPGKTLSQVENPDSIVVHPLNRCECGADLSRIAAQDYEARQVFDLPLPRLEITEHRGEIKTCPRCARTLRASFPQPVRAPVQYGPSFQGLLVYLRDGQLLPLNRISQVCADLFGATVSEATVEAARRDCAAHLEPFAQALHQALLASKVLHADESGLRTEKKLAWLHVLSSSLLTFYGVHARRGAEAMESFDLLPCFSGTLVHDFWKPYLNLASSHALCNAHLLRELKSVSEQEGQLWAQRMSDLLLKMKRTPHTRTFSAWKAHYRKLLKQADRENPQPPSRTGSRGRLKKTKAQNLIARLREYQKNVLAFLQDPNIPFTNNQAERDIRMIRVQQKISGTFRTFTGAHLFARIRSYISTLRKHHLNVFQQIVHSLQGYPWIPQLVPRGPE